MAIRTFEAVVENGTIRLLGNVHLPEKAIVYVIAPDVESNPSASIASPHLVHPEDIQNFQMEVVEETRDDAV